MVAATWSIEPAEVNAMFMPPKYYKLLTPLNKLDPTDPRKVENWLIKLRAVADCKARVQPDGLRLGHRPRALFGHSVVH